MSTYHLGQPDRAVLCQIETYVKKFRFVPNIIWLTLSGEISHADGVRAGAVEEDVMGSKR